MSIDCDVAIVGGGIVGLAHAWMAARRGMRVILFERCAAAEGATVRNFGMIWPVGQPAGECYSIALASRALWRQLGAEGVLAVEECGSIHLAHRSDELAVLEEFRDRASHPVELLTPEEILLRAPLVNPQGLLGGMWSPTELRVDPRSAGARIADWLHLSRQVECRFGTPIVRIEGNALHAADGRRWNAERIIVCSGSDLETLFPEQFRASGLVPCKLQMLKLQVSPRPGTTAPHLAGGLTLRHYAAFRDCPSLPRLEARIAAETPELNQFGIHVMASRFPDGSVILGDSHEYADAISPFDKTEIDELILREIQSMIRLGEGTLTERWHGIYAKHPTLPVFEDEASPGVRIFAGTGGAGMTMAFGLAERAWNRWMGETR
jgi:D-hydroxyproline dehydrogenase subunit beta